MHSFKPLLISGQMRSGTSLLANFLDAQTEITVHRDRATVLFRNQHGVEHPLDFLVELSLTDKQAIRQSISKNLDIIFAAKERDEGRLLAEIKENYRLDFNVRETKNYRDIIFDSFAAMANKKDRYVGTKVTLCEHNINAFIDQVDGKVISIVRNPMSVIQSLICRGFMEGKLASSASKYIHSWKRGANRLLECNKDNLFIVRFEDFISDKSAVSKALAQFLEVNINPNINTLKDYSLPWFGNSSFDKNLIAVDNSVESRKIELPDDLRHEIKVNCHDEMAKLGYL
ncbi:MAG: hypothetical protein Alis3KO_21150 [Aliiglaciecola sp.]